MKIEEKILLHCCKNCVFNQRNKVCVINKKNFEKQPLDKENDCHEFQN